MDVVPTIELDMDQFGIEYPPLDADGFDEEILERREFYEMRFNRTTAGGGGIQLYPYQEMVVRYMSPFTLYDRVLLFHAMGTGKTVTCLSVIENLISNSPFTFKRALVIVPNDRLVTDYVNTLVFMFPEKYAVPLEDNYPPIDALKRQRRAQLKLVHAYYIFNTSEKFYTANKGRSLHKFSDRVIVLDEVHRLNTLGDDARYQFFHTFLHEVRNCKVLIATGTPMVNSETEFAKLLNLILPRSTQLPNKAADLQQMMENGELAKFVRGRISFMRAPDMGVKVDILGTEVFLNGPDESPMKLVLLPMRPPQLAVYRSAYESERGTQYALREQTQRMATSAAVFPQLRGSEAERLAQLGEYSSKFAHIISLALERHKMFVYLPLVKVKGKPLVQVLGLFGYNLLKQAPTLPPMTSAHRARLENEAASGKALSLTAQERAMMGKRVTILSTSVLTGQIDTAIAQLLDVFNDVRNVYGDFLQIVIGGKQIAEGIMMRDVARVLIVSAHWNHSVLDQVIARCVRIGSHRRTNATVGVEYLCATDADGDSIDLEMYRVAQEKDRAIQKFVRFAQEQAFDCAINYERNERKSEKGSRTCYYGDCNVRCANVSFPYERELLNTLTYDLLYADAHEKVLSVLQMRESEGLLGEPIDFQVFMQDYFPTTSAIVVLRALSKLVLHNVSFMNRFQRRCVLRVANGVLFFTPLGDLWQDPQNAVMTRHPLGVHPYTLWDAVEDEQQRAVFSLEDEQVRTPEELVLLLQGQSRAFQAHMFELMYATQPPTDVSRAVVDAYRDYRYLLDENHELHSILYGTRNGLMREFACEAKGDDEGSCYWRDAEPDTIRTLFSRYFIAHNPVDLYCRVNLNNDERFVVDLHTPVKDIVAHRGRKCHTYSRNELKEFMERLGLAQKLSNKTDMCTAIMGELMRRRAQTTDGLYWVFYY